MSFAVELRHVTKRYADILAVDHLSVTVPSGCVHGILGRNGAGKTTTIRMLMGILRPDAGSIAVLGVAPAQARSRLGYLPEEKGLYRKMRLLDLVSYFGRLKGMSRHAATTEADRPSFARLTATLAAQPPMASSMRLVSTSSPAAGMRSIGSQTWSATTMPTHKQSGALGLMSALRKCCVRESQAATA